MNNLADDLTRTIRDPSLMGKLTVKKEGDREIARYRGKVVKVLQGVSFDDL